MDAMTDVDVGLVLDCAALAPSVHNTQPWAFDAQPDAIRVRADRNRQLKFLDASGRQLHISCGIAVEFARLAIRSQDRQCDVSLLPDPTDPDLVAELVIGTTQPATDDERRLVEAMPRRYTDRRPYADARVSPEAVDRLRQAAENAGAWLHVIDRPEDRITVAAILTDAEAAEAADPAYAEELAKWTHSSPAAEGLTPEAAPSAWPAGVVSDMPLRDFGGHGQHPHPGADEPPRVERDTLVLVGSDHDDPHSWLVTGRAVADVLLTATVDTLTAQPLGPATDFPEARARLRHELRLVGHPQFLFRLGYGQDRPWTGRRSH